MSDREHTAKSTSHRTGLFATLSNPLRAKGTGAPSSRRTPSLRAGSATLAAKLLGLLALALAALFATAAPALAAGPSATIDPPIGSFYTSAHLTGTFDPGDGTGASYYTWETSQDGLNWSGFTYEGNAPQGSGPQPISKDFGELTASTEYHFRISVAGGDGIVSGYSNELVFTTNSPPTNPPTLTTNPASAISYTTAHLSGTLDPEGGNLEPSSDPLPIAWHFQYSADDVNWADAPGGGEISGAESQSSAPIAVSADLTGLTQHSAYFFRLVAVYGGVQATSPEPDPSFETLEVTKPTVSIDPVGVFTDTTATFSGHVNPNAPAGPLDPAVAEAFRTDWNFHCVPDCGSTAGSIDADNADNEVKADLSGLEPDTTYEVTLEAANFGGPSTATTTFATKTIPPTVKAAPGASDGQGGYTLQAVVNPHNSALSACEFKYGPTAPAYAFAVSCSPTPGEVNKPVTVEGHVTGLTPGATYHAQLIVTNSAGTEKTDDQLFVPTQNPPEACPNETLRKENNSLALPECRAYEMVSPPNKAGGAANLFDYDEDGSSFAYTSRAGNLANSGQGATGVNYYVADRSATGWETIPDLNGSTSSLFSGPEGLFIGSASALPIKYSADLHSSLWYVEPGGQNNANRAYIRGPDGRFTLVGNALSGASSRLQVGEGYEVGFSADLSHLVFNGVSPNFGPVYGLGVYEFIGTGNDLPQRVDVDNLGDPIGQCGRPTESNSAKDSTGNAVSGDGNTVVLTVFGGCSATNPPSNEIWARVGEATSYDVSASQCARGPADPCNPPADAHFQGAAGDGSRVYFTTTQQLVDGDTDETNDLYACDMPLEAAAPTGRANPCSSLSEVSGSGNEAQVEEVLSVSDDGSTVYFLAQGVLAPNEDALGEEAVAGGHNLYVWRTDAAHPAGQTAFVARLDSSDVGGPQTTADGRYLAFTTASQLTLTDTDNSRDVYRYDADAAAMTRVSTNVLGVAGNAEDSDAELEVPFGSSDPRHQAHPSVSDDGDSIVFTTAEALSPRDGNDVPDVYIWHAGRVSLITTGSVGGGTSAPEGSARSISIDGSGQDIYFTTAQQLTPSDGDDVADVYDARIGGGFSFAAAAPCSGETCQPPVAGPPAAPIAAANRPNGEGNVKPKHCPKGKVAKGNKCVKKSHGGHHKEKGKGHAHRAGHNRGGAE